MSSFSANSSISNGVGLFNGTLEGTLSFKRGIYAGDDGSSRLFGTAQCPRMEDISVIEPLVCKKISHERLSVLHFREGCLVTACQEGFVLTWARPEKVFLN